MEEPTVWTDSATPPLPPSVIKNRSSHLGARHQGRSTAAPPPSRNNELEALRQRGLTTLLNRHFTEKAQECAVERAAADAAMADLQARKAATSEFVPSRQGELSPLDALYVKVNQWQKDCRKKEKETLLLYQRYVNKFGASGQVEVPGVSAASPSSASHHYVPSTPPSWSTTSRGIGLSPDTPRASHPPPESTPSSFVPAITQKIEQSLSEYLQSGGMELPSMNVLGKDQTFQEVFAKHEQEFKSYYRRQLEARGVDAKTSTRWAHMSQEEREKEAYNGPGGVVTKDPHRPKDESTGLIRTVGELEKHETYGQNTDVDIGDSRPYFVNEDYDDRSLVSGLTTLNSAETRRVLRDCERSVATFLRDEHEAIKRLMVEEEEDSDATSDLGSITKAADQAEDLVKEMQSILDDFTVHSTVHGVTDEDTTAAQKAGGRRYYTSNPDEYWVAYYDEAYQREYYHERNTNRTQWEPPDADSTSQSNSQSSPAEADMLMYDQVMPETSLRGNSSSKSTSLFEQYRRKQRRARKRRNLVIVISAIVVALLAIGYAAYVKYEKQAAARHVPVIMEQEAEPDAKTPLTLWDTLRALETERLALFEEERQMKERRRRPWICNLPFSYVLHSRCRELADENPFFDLQALINAMLQ